MNPAMIIVDSGRRVRALGWLLNHATLPLGLSQAAGIIDAACLLLADGTPPTTMLSVVLNDADTDTLVDYLVGAIEALP